jgi:hypothetical protein
MIGGVTGSLAWPVTLLVGRLDSRGVLRDAGQTIRSTPASGTS